MGCAGTDCAKLLDKCWSVGGQNACGSPNTPSAHVIPEYCSTRQKKLRKGTVIAQCQELQSVHQHRDEDREDVNEIPAHLQPLYAKSVLGLEEEKAMLVQELLIEYADIFSKGSDDLGRTGLVKHRI